MNYILTLFISLIMLSCGIAKEKTTLQNEAMQQSNQTEQLNGKYTITQLETDVTMPTDLTLNFDAKTNRVSGFSGCNNFSGNYSAQEGTIHIEGIITTLRACIGDTNTIEKKLFKSLGTVNMYEIKENVLYLKKEDDLLITGKKTAIKTEANTINTSKNFENTNKNTSEDTTIITYQAMSRGFFEKIWITKESVTVSTDRNLKEKSNYSCSEKDWNDLLTILNTIDLKKVPLLEAPTQKRFYDGAAIASLSINQNGNETKTTAFDHGYPPEAIKELVEKIISIKDLAVKQ